MEEGSNSGAPAAASLHEGTFGAAASAALSWAVVALVQAIVDVAKLGGAQPLHVLVGAAELAVGGALSAAAVVAFARSGLASGSRRERELDPGRSPATGRARQAAALAAAGVLFGALLLRDDAAGIAGTSTAARALVGGAVGLSIPVVALGAAWIAARLPPVPAAIGVVAVIANNLALERGYFGLHLFAVWIGALCIGASIAVLPGETVARLSPAKLRPLAWGLLGIVALAGVVVSPSGPVQLEMYKTPGDALAPWLARAKGNHRSGARFEGPWYADRSALPDTPPTTPPLLTRPPIVVLLTVDAFRWDLVDAETYKEQLPVFHRLRDVGAYFREARAPSPSTVTSISTIFTGRFFSQLYWTEQTGGGHQKLFPFQDETARLPTLLKARDVATALVVSGTGFADKYGLTNGFAESIGKGSPVGIPAAQITAQLVKRLEKQGAGPLFMYSHYFEPHAPYDRGGKQGTEFERYVKEVVLVDTEIGKLLEAVERLGLQDRFILMVTADHGEAFGEHGTKEHGVSLYEELLRVPLIITGAGVSARRVDTPVSLTDLGPTILDIFGAPTPAKFLAESLLPLLRREPSKLTRPLVAESGRFVRAMYFEDGKKIIEDRRLGTTELYDLVADPTESKNLWSPGDAAARARLERLQAFFEAHALHRDGYELPYRP